MRIISPVTVELTDAELVTIQRALERWSGVDYPLAQLIGAVAETGGTFTLATKAPVDVLRRGEEHRRGGSMITFRDDSIEWDAKDIRAACDALLMVANIYRDPAIKEQAKTASAVWVLRRWEALAAHLDELRHGLEGLQRQQVQPRIKLTTEDS